VELLVVVAVIAVLAALILPAVRSALQSARRAKAVGYLRQVALAHAHYTCSPEGDLRSIVLGDGATAHDWFGVLAGKDYLSDPRLVMFDFDYLVKSEEAAAGVFGAWGGFFGVLPRRLCGTSRQGLDPDFAGKPLSIVVVAGLPAYLESPLPLCWTRGLNAQGYWNEAQGPQGGVFGTSGGVIAFTDGSARWFDDLHGSGHPLCQWSTGQSTSNIFECFPSGAYVLGWQGRLHSLSPEAGSGESSPVLPASEEDGDGAPEAPEPETSAEGGEGTPAPDYGSFGPEIDFSHAEALGEAADACGVGEVYANILNTYRELAKGSGASNEAIDTGIGNALAALASSLTAVGIDVDMSSDEAKAMYWSGFLGDEGVDYTDNQDVFGRDPQADAASALDILGGVDAALCGAYGSLSEAQKLQFSAMLQAFAAGTTAGQDIDFDSAGAKLAKAYLDTQAWIAAMRRTLP